MTDIKPGEEQTGGGIDVSWIYYVIFRHKWKIVLLSIAGIAAAGAVAYFKKPVYQSSASLLIKYIKDSSDVATTGQDAAQIKSTDTRGDNIITAETEILRS